MAESSRSYFGTANTWGGSSKTLLKQSPRLLQIERSNTDATIVFVSDCWLDNGEVNVLYLLECHKLFRIGTVVLVSRN